MSTLSRILLFVVVSSGVLSAQGTQLLRQPTLSSSDVVFVYANDLWKVSKSGGDAIRLTSNEGYELLPHFSPDEKHIAFSAQYGGNVDVFVIPSEGGSPMQLTWHPGGDFVQGWTPDGNIVFRSGREGHPTRTNRLYTVSLQGGLPKSLDVPRAAFGEISPDGKFIAYVPITFWDPEWRNYRGGQAMPIWILDMETKELTRTPQPTQERHLDPVWLDGVVYYLSERDYASNIWSFDPTDNTEEQVTFHRQFDVKSLDASGNELIYEQGGYLHLLSPETKESRQLEIHVKGDMNFSRTRWEDLGDGDLTNVNVSPQARRILFEHRGEVFSTPKEEGSWRNLSRSPGVADRFPIWSPKGDQVAWFSDESGEYQLVLTDQYGRDKRSIALPNPSFYFTPDWSPDGRFIAFTDTDYNLWYVDIESGESTLVDTDRYAHPNRAMNPIWSPDSKWIAYARQTESHFKAVFIHDVGTSTSHQLTDGMADAITPVWDQGGEKLYFLASTDYGLNSGWLDMSSYDPEINRSLYCILLNQEVKSPRRVKSDEEQPEEEEREKESNEETDGGMAEEESTDMVVDLNNLSARIVALDLPSANYAGLHRGPENSVFITELVAGQNGMTLHKYDVEKMEAKDFDSGVQSVTPNFDGSNVLYRKSGSWYLVETSSPPSNGKGKLEASARVQIDPRSEYHQIFKEGWRYMRDFLYVNNVHGAPWSEVYEWYAPWIDHVRHRTDLNYVVDIMSGEVSVGHSYVSGGDLPDLDRIPVGLLGCDFEEQDGFYKIAKVYTGESWNPDVEAPLHIPGENIHEGDYLLAINGRPLRAPDNPYRLLQHTAGLATMITINSQSTFEGASDVMVRPVASEFQLRNWDWIEGNRKKVDELSNGQLAYVYVPNTGGRGFAYFNRFYFAQQDKKGVVIDERNNGGGSAADYMIDIMSRTLFGYFNSKANDNRPWTTPMAGIWGPKVMIINERAGSGGDLLPYMFKAKGIGPLIGTRTWGGLVGTWDTPRFIDGGRMVAPRGGFYDLDGRWAVEGEGIAPDIEVIQEPKLVLQGRDPQLERAVEEAMKLIQIEAFQLMPEPPPPVRWKRPSGFEKN